MNKYHIGLIGHSDKFIQLIFGEVKTNHIYHLDYTETIEIVFHTEINQLVYDLADGYFVFDSEEAKFEHANKYFRRIFNETIDQYEARTIIRETVNNLAIKTKRVVLPSFIKVTIENGEVEFSGQRHLIENWFKSVNK